MSDKWILLARPVRNVMDAAGALLTDEQALTVQALYPQWKNETNYLVGDRVLYQNVLYRCLQAHKSQPGWNPAAAHSVWAKVLTSETGDILPWEQPDSTNVYSKGDKVTHNGKTWISIVDNNSWEPGVYGWEEI